MVIDSCQVTVVDLGVFASQSRWRLGNPFLPAGSRSDFARCKRPVWEPPEKNEAEDYADEAVEKEHPLETDEAAGTVH